MAVRCRFGDGANAVAKDIQAAGGKAHAFPMDVTNGRAALDAVAFGAKEFGSVDVLVNNAAIDIIEPVQEVSQESWNRILNVNLTGVFQCSQAAADQMIRQGTGGSIINVSSIASTAGIEKLAAYSAAKAGVNQLTRELASHRIRVNAIPPGYLENLMDGASREHSDLRKEQQILASTPLGRRAQLSEIVGPVVFLASEAASYVTGTVLFVDGGYTARSDVLTAQPRYQFWTNGQQSINGVRGDHPASRINKDHTSTKRTSGPLGSSWFNFRFAGHALVISSSKNGSSTSHKLGFVVQFGHSIRSVRLVSIWDRGGLN